MARNARLRDFAWPLRFQRRADREGWNIFDSNYGREIEKCDDMSGMFTTDEEAIAFVYGIARYGKAQHALRALQIQAQDCTCHAHGGVVCPGDDCDGCDSCPTGRARRYLAAIEGE